MSGKQTTHSAAKDPTDVTTIAQESAQSPRTSRVKRCLDVLSGAECFHTPDGDPYLSIETGGHRETWPVKSTGCKLWIRGEFYRVEDDVLSGEDLATVVNTLAARACFGESAKEMTVYTRIAYVHGEIYHDLVNTHWQQVRITRNGWSIVESADSVVRFQRRGGMLALPLPDEHGTLDPLCNLINSATEHDHHLIITWLLSCFSEGPYPVLILRGGQGSGKTTAGILLRSLVDPNVAPLRAAPREERDLAIAARNGRVVAYDNLSTLPVWLSDALCRLATGGALSTRALRTDDEEKIFSYKLPCLLTSIEDVVTRGDLLDRSVLPELIPFDTEEDV